MFIEWAVWDAIYIALIPATIISLAAMVIGSLLTQKSLPPKPILDAEGNEASN